MKQFGGILRVIPRLQREQHQFRADFQILFSYEENK